MAEKRHDKQNRFVYKGNFGETVDNAVRPIAILYEISSLSFHTLDHMPANFSVGQLSWRADSSGLVGVAWRSEPFPQACPGIDVANHNLTEFKGCAFCCVKHDNSVT